jgi:hypothetical protein
LDLRKGSVGGDSGLEAVSPAPVFLVKVGPSLPEKKKTKKPMQRTAASTRVMGFERRNERDMVGEGEEPGWPGSASRLWGEHQKRRLGVGVGVGGLGGSGVELGAIVSI